MFRSKAAFQVYMYIRMYLVISSEKVRIFKDCGSVLVYEYTRTDTKDSAIYTS